ncbi:hypothetical protein [Ottowia sp.]|uniref:hypothetical protein n=1 Tax=Ottowia sp. TaxID=1898956 RepID=UPI0025F85052|nr:hypothetical protein [Ottowia sp.]MBK6616679.1 hypothetical protein [Ottowia sp.]
MNKGDLGRSSLIFSQAELDRLKMFESITRSGVVYHGELAGPGGMSFVLIREADTTDEMLEKAVEQLRRDQDVVGAILVADAPPPAVQS